MTTRFRTSALSLLAAVVLFAGGRAHIGAAGPSFWTVASQAGFLQGTPTGVSIDDAGRLVVAPLVSVVADLTAPQSWSLARTADGTWFAGTGGTGRVLRGRGAQVDTILNVEPSAIHALAVVNGRVFAASSPDGRVHIIEPDGSSRVFFDPAESYIWALAADQQGRLWVGAGHPAVIYRVDAAGTSQVVYRPSARHVVSLAMDTTGRMYAGTDTPARLYRFGDADRPFVVFEPGLTELRAIVPSSNGTLYVAALSSGGDAAPDTGMTGSVTIIVAGTNTGTASTTTPATPDRRSTIFRVTPDGTWDALWETADAVYDLAVRDTNSLLVATGPAGRLYQVSTAPATWGAATLVNTVDAKQITRLATDGTRTLALTANPGRVVAVATAPAQVSSYASPVRDAKTTAQWGSIRWEGVGSVALQTRSGNTHLPDDSWSPWAAPTPQASGFAITNPSARFLQWRATLTPGTVAPVVTSVTVAYLPRNLRPVVSEITVHPPGVVFQRPFSSDEGAIAGLDESVAVARRPPGGDPTAPGTSVAGRRMFSRGLQTLGWKAEDPDADRLLFALRYRLEGEAAWSVLREGLADPLFVWDTTSVPDGRYLMRVTASDTLSNTPERVLAGDRESTAIDIDNTPPVITMAVTGTRVAIRVTDAHSGVHRVDYSLGGQTWQLLRPLDGLEDSRQEQFEVTLPTAADAARLVLRASDVMQNVTSAVAGR